MALLLVTGGLLGWWSPWSTSRARAGRQTGSSRQCETRSAIICSMQPSRGVGRGNGSALTTAQSEGGYMESAIYGSAREGDAAQAGAGWRYSRGHGETGSTGSTGSKGKPQARRHAGTSSSRWSKRAPHHRRRLLGLAPMGPPARTGLDETRRDETWEAEEARLYLQ